MVHQFMNYTCNFYFRRSFVFEMNKRAGSAGASLDNWFVKRRTTERDKNSTSQLSALCVSSSPSPSVAVSSLETSELKWPSVWNDKQVSEFTTKYTWLTASEGKLGCKVCAEVKHLGALKEQRIAISLEWATCNTTCNLSDDRNKALSAFRGKIKKHSDSVAHKLASESLKKKEMKTLEAAANELSKHHIEKTEAIFRSVYYLAKQNRPFSDHQPLVELQQLNGVDMGNILHSRFTATNIVSHIASEMRDKIVANIVTNDSKIAVLIDESTTMSKKSVMTVHLKAVITVDDTISEPEFLFLSLCELESGTAECISKTLLQLLSEAGFSKEFLEKNWIAFISDGASVLMGRQSGVAARLLDEYPNLFIWHCLNHRLELAIADAIKEINGINHLQIFMDKLYSIYSQSTKNAAQIKALSESLHLQCLKIGRILNVRWVASSFRTVDAVYSSFECLAAHLQASAEDTSRDSLQRQQFKGMRKRLVSYSFVSDLGIMHDVLKELSLLSLELQRSNMTLPMAERCIKRTIRILQSLEIKPGPKVLETEEALKEGRFCSIQLEKNYKWKPIDKKRFLQSVCNSMEHRLIDHGRQNDIQTVNDMKVLEKEQWPDEPDLRFGEAEIRRMARRFKVDEEEAVMGMRAKIDGERNTSSLYSLTRAVNTIPCSSAQCERDFSLMNTICTDRRANLLVENTSSLMFLHSNGPPLCEWNANYYVKRWLLKHRSAVDTQSRKTVPTKESKKAVWSIL